jgi:hypothetical protein
MQKKIPDKVPLTLLTLLGKCACDPFGQYRDSDLQNAQLLELHTVRFIGLGALMDELTPRQRVYDTLEQLTARSDRLVSVGYLVTEGKAHVNTGKKVAATVPLDSWIQNIPNERSMSRPVKHIVDCIRVSYFVPRGWDTQTVETLTVANFLV